MMRVEYEKQNGEYSILEGKFCKWHTNKRGQEYLTMMCWDDREAFRRIHPDRIISISKSKIEI